MFAVLHRLDLPVIDMLPDDSVIVRDDAVADSRILSELMDEKSIRWSGDRPIAWRVSPELSFLAGRVGIQVDIDITPSSDLSQRDVDSLSSDLRAISGVISDRPICDLSLIHI